MTLECSSTVSPQRPLIPFQCDAEARLSHAPVPVRNSRPAAELLHELQVHQVELEMKNENLQQSQIELEASRERYANLYEFSPVGFLTLNKSCQITKVNHTGSAMLGMERSQLHNRRVDAFVALADRDRWQRQFVIAMAQEGMRTFDLTLVRQDASQCDVQISCLRQEIGGSNPTLQVSMMDITERKRSERAVERELIRLQTVLKMAGDGIHILDDEGLLVEANEAFLTMLGYDQSVVGRLRVSEWDALDSWDVIKARIADLIARRGHEVFETRHRRSDGLILEIEINVSGMEIDGKGFLYAASRDITKRKRLEHLLQEKAIELEKAKLAAETANSAKSEFLASMSHELRTPLNAVLGFAQLMEAARTPPSEMQKQSIDQILKAGWHLLGLINEILDLAKIESGKIIVSREPISIPELLADCHAMIEPQAQNAGIRLHFPRFDNPCHVLGDPTGIKQAMINLLSNAIKYNRSEGQVTVSCTMSGEQRIRISVEDTGAGLAPEQLSQLFQPFNRLGQECGSVEGTGIGLVVTKQLIEMMGGIIGVDSIVGAGSMFWFELAVSSAPKLSSSNFDGQVLRERESVQTQAAQRTVLYVEDNPANLALVEALIGLRPDLKLLTAVDGPLGIQMACSYPPDLILMDINLHGVSGYEALKILREDPTTAQIPIIALSAKAMARDIEQGLEAGFSQYITKPIKVNEFMEAIDRALCNSIQH